MRRERGAALTEFAIGMPLVIALIYASTYLMDAGLYKLKAQEIARYGAWSLATRPLSDFQEFEHGDRFERMRDSVKEELAAIYHDLDGTTDDTSAAGEGGSTRQSMAAVYEAPSSSDLRNEQVSLVPLVGSANYAEPLSGLGIGLALLGLGPNLDNVAAGVYERLDLNSRGQVTARATVELRPPWGAERQARAQAMASAGEERGADLGAWTIRSTGRRIRDRDNDYLAMTLVADSWRVPQGWAASPGKHTPERGHYINVVRRMHDKLGSALPGFGLLSSLLDIGALPTNIYGGLAAFLPGGVTGLKTAQVVSRPYTADRQPSPPRSAAEPLTGQVNVFRYADRQRAEDNEGDAVKSFETLPIFVDPEARDNAHLRALNARGPNFMGCERAQERGCDE